MLPYKTPRPSLQERHDRIVISLADINRHIERLAIAYRQDKNEYVLSVLNDLIRARDDTWDQEYEWRDQELNEAFLYFDQLPYSVRLFLTDEKLR